LAGRTKPYKNGKSRARRRQGQAKNCDYLGKFWGSKRMLEKPVVGGKVGPKWQKETRENINKKQSSGRV